MKSTEDKQMSLPIPCEKCEAQTVDTCVCDWEMPHPTVLLTPVNFDDLKEFLDKEIIYGE
jgi:hypothetical protein